MGADSVLVVDAGTSAMRASLVRADGAVTAIGVERYHLLAPEDAAPFGSEYDPAELSGSLRRLISAAASYKPRIAAIAFTGQREGVAFLDEAGMAVFASPNIDARAAAEGMAIDAGYGEEVYRRTGHLPSLLQIPAKLAWLRDWRPDVARRIATAMPLVDWLASTETGGAPVMSRSLAAENGVLDVSTGAVPAGLLAKLGVETALLSRVVADGSIAGNVASGELGGVPIVLAGADTQCALIGMGAVEPGDVGVAAGWSAPVQMVTPAPVFDDALRTWTSVHAAARTWILESNAGEAGRSYDWLRTMLGLSHEDAASHAQASPAGARDVVCVAGARAMVANAMTAAMGAVMFPTPLVVSEPTRGDLIRASLEGIACSIRANVEQLEIVSAREIGVLRVGSGMSRSPVFAKILAGIVDRPVIVTGEPETSSLGAAVLASVAVGLHSTLEEGLQAMTAGGCMLRAEPDQAASYEDVYARWSTMAEALPRLAAEAG